MISRIGANIGILLKSFCLWVAPTGFPFFNGYENDSCESVVAAILQGLSAFSTPGTRPGVQGLIGTRTS